jgi:uncharacterized protein (TIGR02246 family)
MHRFASLAAVAAVLGLAACQTKPQPLTAADSTAIGQLRSAFETAWNAGNVNAIMALHTADAVLEQGDSPERDGQEAIRGYYDTTLGTPQRPTIAIERKATMGRQDLATEIGTYTLTFPAAAGAAAPPPLKGKYLVVLQKQADGSWKVAWDAGSLDAPLPPPTPPEQPKRRSRR